MDTSASPYQFNSSSKIFEQSSQKSEKMVTSCKNCSYSFRIEFSESVDFCSKDCQTCFTMFRRNGQIDCFTTPKRPKTVAEIKRSIYEFQSELEDIDRQKYQEAQRVREQTALETAAQIEAYEKLFKPKVKKCPDDRNNSTFFIFSWNYRNKPQRSQLHKFF